LPGNELNNLFLLELCFLQSCFLQGECELLDINQPSCLQCRLDGLEDPQGYGCADQADACGV
jgi:hypothetical protein